MAQPLAGTPNLDEVVRVARSLGCVVEIRHRTGEWKFSHPKWNRCIVVNARRKDTPRVVLVAVRNLMKEAA